MGLLRKQKEKEMKISIKFNNVHYLLYIHRDVYLLHHEHSTNCSII